jgi:hypothetical protein
MCYDTVLNISFFSRFLGLAADDVFKSIKKSCLQSRLERRRHPRKACRIEVNYMVEGRWYRGSILNISQGGAYILSSGDERFFPGEGIFLVAKIRVLREQVRGKIVRVGLLGKGVEFQS